MEALEPLGHKPATVRQSLCRMVGSGALETRKRGRMAWYRLSCFGRSATDAGTIKLFESSQKKWDGRWTVVSYRFETKERRLRHQLRELLEVEGFGELGRGVYLHPRERTESVLNLVRGTQMDGQVNVFRASRLGGESDHRLVRRLWKIETLNRGYQAFLGIYEPHARRPSASWSPADAFSLRLALVLCYLETAWRDPGLPPALLPKQWKGWRAQAIAASLYTDLLPGTLRHGDALATDVGILEELSRPSGRLTSLRRKQA